MMKRERERNTKRMIKEKVCKNKNSVLSRKKKIVLFWIREKLSFVLSFGGKEERKGERRKREKKP